MKRTFTLLLALTLVASVNSLKAQDAAPSPLQKISQMVGLTEVKIEYSRPSLDGRDMYTTLTPVGKRWRTGANTRTVISFSKDVKLNGNEVKAGDYNLFTIPGKNEWSIILNSNTAETNPFRVDDKNNILTFKVTPATSGTKIETFTINVTDFDKNAKDNANIELAWENTSVKFKIEVTN
ncbi:MAG: DUF2911 domain-containing protein [Roseivirga sp.]|nr:DUF2911 domain-containing protein [Roseivirga sp.]